MKGEGRTVFQVRQTNTQFSRHREFSVLPVCTTKSRAWLLLQSTFPFLWVLISHFWHSYLFGFGSPIQILGLVRLVCPSYAYVNFLAWLASFCVSSWSAKVLALWNSPLFSVCFGLTLWTQDVMCQPRAGFLSLLNSSPGFVSLQFIGMGHGASLLSSLCILLASYKLLTFIKLQGA